MRVILLLFLFTICSTGNTTTDDTVDIEPYQIIGDTVFIKNKLSSINNIANVQSSFVMSSLKDTTAIPIIA